MQQLGDGDVVGTPGRDVADAVQDLVRAVASRAEGQPDLTARRSQAPADLHQPGHPGLVVGVIGQNDASFQLEEIGPSRVGLWIEDERAQSLHHGILRQAGTEGRRCGGHGVLGVGGGDAGEGERDVLQGEERVGAHPSRDHRQPAVDYCGGPATFGDGRTDGGVIGVHREEPGPSADPSAHGEHARVVGVEHVPPFRPRDLCHGGLHLGELIERPDPVQIQMVGGHVGDHADVVVQRADASKEDATPGRLQHGQLDAGLRKRSGGASEPRIVTLFHEPVV